MSRFLFKAQIAATAASLAIIQVPAEASSRWVTATVYHPWYHGRQTACGQTYQHWSVSAAHPWLPCGTKVRVAHRGKTLIVPITDRCNCASIDLSAGAASRLGVPVDGIAKVLISH
jgi:rare lipoprotein A